ncbi:hypothetical protein BDZ91DRAFT_725715 [Kalaharituber pfeilii]|nr:hypothetical protein BDZ91DRAFT_725715 [Kalaharituber pfeilii]
MEGRLVRKCWLGIQSAFTSCLIIFLELAILRRQFNAQPQLADVELVSRCMYALEYCAAADSIARSFLNTLVPIRNLLFAGMPGFVASALHPQSQHAYHHPQPKRFPTPQYRSSSFPSSPSSVRSRSPSASPSKRPRILASTSNGARSNSVPSIPSISTTAVSYGGVPPVRMATFSTPVPMSQMLSGQTSNMIDRSNGGGPINHVGSSPTGSSPTEVGSGEGGLNIDLVVTHILECLESPYGGDHNVINESSSNLASFPPNWRFLNPKPPKLPQHNLSMPGTFTHPTPSAFDPVSPGHQNVCNPAVSPTQCQPQTGFFYSSDAQASPSSSFPRQHSPQQRSFHPPNFPPSKQVLPLAQAPVNTANSCINVPTCMRTGTTAPHTERNSVAISGGPLPDVLMNDYDDDSGGDSISGRRRKMPFKSMEEYENFLKRVA